MQTRVEREDAPERGSARVPPAAAPGFAPARDTGAQAGVLSRRAAAGAAPLGVAEVVQLQRALGNHAVGALLQRQAAGGGAPAGATERIEDEERDEEEPAAQRQPASASAAPAPAPARPDPVGVPDGLRSGIEALSGLAMDGVRVHYNSSAPAQVNAHSFARWPDIHIGPGREKDLGHEMWHGVQQMQGRVQPTIDVGGVAVNDDPALEREADEMAARAAASA
jgi:hypothetical protein